MNRFSIIKSNALMITHCFLFIMCLFMQPANAQESTPEIRTINGEEYYLHIVEKGNTLYGLTKKYKVTLEEIQKANPNMLESLSLGQVLKIPAKIEKKIPIRTFRPHTVKRKETVYGICRMYHLSEEELIQHNPTVAAGIHPGDKLQIPVEGGEKKVPQAPDDSQLVGHDAPENLNPSEIRKSIPPGTVSAVPQDKSNFVGKKDDGKEEVYVDTVESYVIEKGKTLYSLSRDYNISIQEIQLANDGLKEGLKVGDTIDIPVKKVRAGDVLEKTIIAKEEIFIPTDSLYYKKQYNILVMVPFELDRNNLPDIEEDPTAPMSSENVDIRKTTKVAMDFYHGVILAIDSLKQAGISLNVSFEDTKRDTNEVKAILKKSAAQNADLIIGPFDKNCIRHVASFVKQKKIHMACPVAQSNKLLFNNPYVSKVVASVSSKVEETAKYVAANYRDQNVILMNSNNRKDKYFFTHFNTEYNNLLKSYNDEESYLLKTSFMKTQALNQLSKQLDSNVVNVIVAPSGNVGFVSNLMTRLNIFMNTEKNHAYEIVVFGLERWQKFEDIDVNYMHKTKLHIASSSYLNYREPRTMSLVKSFRRNFKIDPGKYGLLGFDVTYNYIAGLTHFGSAFYNSLEYLNGNGVSVGFDYERVGASDGYENKKVFILEYNNFELIKRN